MILTNFKSKGIDISYHNGNLDISKFSDVDFVIVRAGFGKNNIDKKFKDFDFQKLTLSHNNQKIDFFHNKILLFILIYCIGTLEYASIQ